MKKFSAAATIADLKIKSAGALQLAIEGGANLSNREFCAAVIARNVGNIVGEEFAKSMLAGKSAARIIVQLPRTRTKSKSEVIELNQERSF